MPAPQRRYTIPHGTREAQCRGQRCRAKIWFVPSGRTDPNTGKERMIPVDADGTPHRETCADSESFTRKRAR